MGDDRALNILIADNDSGDCKLIQKLLKESQLTCDYMIASSIEDAMESCKKNRIDCAIIDYLIPGQHLEGLAGI